ncbi:hypothetical protein J437_LFUL018508 [Ladona fulva]|uniref:Rhabdoid tumor deletion region protein 1 n=1 Tax=Ladona fulva TaxID=123851 RepID=A0A8K0P4U3_LADFU|nr:hypothetical protein J437_LFUL018508 [Ladona fulva]
MYDQHEALSLRGMHILSELLESKLSEIRTAAAACISALLTNPDGKTVANEMDLLKLLLPILFSEDRAESANAAGCITFMTTTTPAKLRAVELDIIGRLLFLAGDFHCLQPQLHCIKALTNIAEAPKGREILRQYGTDKIRSIPSQNEEIVERSICTLIGVIQWKP